MPTVLFLGATSDIAAATVYKFASHGYDIQLASRRVERLEPLCSDIIIRYRVNCSTYEFDAIRFDEHGKFFESLPCKPEIVICAFGYLGDQKKAEENWNEVQSIINANYVGTVSILNVIASYFSEQHKGCIIGISSVAGIRGRRSNYIYGSAKAGFTTYLGGLRSRLYPDGVKVITVLPGFVRTRMTENIALPKLLTASPSDVASAIFKAIKKNKERVYVKWFWRWIMLIIQLIPEGMFKKLKL